MIEKSTDEELNTEQNEVLNEEQLKTQLAERDKRTKVICLVVTIVVIALLIIIIAVAAIEKDSDHCHGDDCPVVPVPCDITKDSAYLLQIMTSATENYQSFK